MDLNDVRSAVTLISLLVFAGLAVWAYSPRRRDDFSAAARAPLEGERDERAERRAAPKPDRAPSGGRSAYSTNGGHHE